jgi:hypothetical protein
MTEDEMFGMMHMVNDADDMEQARAEAMKRHPSSQKQPSMISPERRAEVRRMTAILMMAKGAELPAYLASLSMRQRVYAITCLDKRFPMPNSVYEAMIVAPDLLVTGQGSLGAAALEIMAVDAREEVKKWTPEAIMDAISDAIVIALSAGDF